MSDRPDGSEWGPATYGDPCRECGYRWETPSDAVLALMESITAEFRDAIGDSDGAVVHPDLAWSAKAYVLHVADNLRIWAERVEAQMAGGSELIAPYDERLLGTARNYAETSLSVAWVSIEHAVAQWLATMQKGLSARSTLFHPVRGRLRVEDVMATNCHDAMHHLWDIRRTLAVRSESG